MCSGETTQELKEVISCQKEKITNLTKKLEEFNTVVSERNNLREIYKQIEQNNENKDNGHRKLFTDLLATFQLQTEKLKKAANAEYQWEAKYGKLEDTNNCINRQLKILKCNENKLQSQLEDTETTLKCVQKELCTTKVNTFFL